MPQQVFGQAVGPHGRAQHSFQESENSDTSWLLLSQPLGEDQRKVKNRFYIIKGLYKKKQEKENKEANTHVTDHMWPTKTL